MVKDRTVSSLLDDIFVACSSSFPVIHYFCTLHFGYLCLYSVAARALICFVFFHFISRTALYSFFYYAYYNLFFTILFLDYFSCFSCVGFFLSLNFELCGIFLFRSYRLCDIYFLLFFDTTTFQVKFGCLEVSVNGSSHGLKEK